MEDVPAPDFGPDAGRTDGATTLETPTTSVALDDLLGVPSALYEVLASQKRRSILTYLLEAEDPVSVRELATYVTAEEKETLPKAVTPGQRNEVLVRLTHVHLPKLDKFGLIEWDPDRDEVSLERDNGLVTITKE